MYLFFLSEQIIGRQAFEIKVCASPGRDRNSEESKSQKKTPKLKQIPERNASLINTRSMSRINSICSDDIEVYTLQVKGKKNYEILKYMRDAFDAYSAISKLKKIVSSSDESVTSSNQSFKRKESLEKSHLISLEQFLENIEMCAYYNVIVSKGIRDYNSLLTATKEVLFKFKTTRFG